MTDHKFCLNHKDRASVANCHQCHKPICAACVQQNEQGKFCSTQCGTKYREFKARYKEPDIRTPFSLVGALVGLAILATVLLGLAWVGHNVLGLDFCAPYDYLGKWLGK